MKKSINHPLIYHHHNPTRLLLYHHNHNRILLMILNSRSKILKKIFQNTKKCHFQSLLKNQSLHLRMNSLKLKDIQPCALEKPPTTLKLVLIKITYYL